MTRCSCGARHAANGGYADVVALGEFALLRLGRGPGGDTLKVR